MRLALPDPRRGEEKCGKTNQKCSHGRVAPVTEPGGGEEEGGRRGRRKGGSVSLPGERGREPPQNFKCLLPHIVKGIDNTIEDSVPSLRAKDHAPRLGLVLL